MLNARHREHPVATDVEFEAPHKREPPLGDRTAQPGDHGYHFPSAPLRPNNHKATAVLLEQRQRFLIERPLAQRAVQRRLESRQPVEDRLMMPRRAKFILIDEVEAIDGEEKKGTGVFPRNPEVHF